ncbi:MAG: ROK family transcriptional regulator [Firmicutes bacterium]|nr:ROK family transcriptional regulator [Bacillota bacterium]
MARAGTNQRSAVPSLLKEINRALILNALRQRQQASRAELAKDLRISKPTVSAIVNELLERGFVIESQQEELTGALGRRPLMLSINRDVGGIIAVKLGVTFVKAAVFDLNQTMLSRSMKLIGPPNPDEKPAAFFVRVVRSVVDDVVNAAGFSRFPGLGIGIEGVVDTATGVLTSSPYHPYWNGIDVRRLLEEEFHVPVFVDNGVNVAAIGEGYAVRGESRNLVTLNITDTVTAGLLIKGEPYRGRANNVGDIGHVMVTEKPIPCICGRTGCFAAMASEQAVRRLAREALERGESLLGSEATVPAVLAASAQGCGAAQAILREVGQYLGYGIAAVASLLNPDVIVLDGRIVRESRLVYDSAMESYRGRISPGFADGTSVVLSSLKGDASLVGACILVLEHIFAPPVLKPSESEAVDMLG